MISRGGVINLSVFMLLVPLKIPVEEVDTTRGRGKIKVGQTRGAGALDLLDVFFRITFDLETHAWFVKLISRVNG